MINEIEWIDDTNILLATGNGLRIFNTVEEIFTDDILSGENNQSRLWVSNFEKINNSEYFLSTGQKGVIKSNIIEENKSKVNDNLSNIKTKNQEVKTLENEKSKLSFDAEEKLDQKIRPPTDANSEFLANRAMGDWAENLIINQINSDKKYLALRYGS